MKIVRLPDSSKNDSLEHAVSMKLHRHETKHEEALWEQMASTLDQGDAAAKRKKRFAFWLRAASIVMGVGFLAFMAGYYWSPDTNRELAGVPVSTPTPTPSTTIPEASASTNTTSESVPSTQPTVPAASGTSNTSDNSAINHQPNTAIVADNEDTHTSSPAIVPSIVVNQHASQHTQARPLQQVSWAKLNIPGHIAMHEHKLPQASMAPLALAPVHMPKLEISKKHTKADWSYTLLAGAFNSFRFLRNKQPDNAVSYFNHKFRNAIERPRTGYTVGVQTGYDFSHRWSVTAGLQHTTTGEWVEFGVNDVVIVDTNAIKGIANQGINPFTENTSLVDSIRSDQSFAHKNTYRWLEIPVALNYHALKRPKVSLFFTAGLSYNVLLQSDVVVADKVSEAFYRVDESDLSNYFNVIAGAGMDYRITDETSLRIQPQAKVAAQNINNYQTDLSYRPYSLGVTAGLNYRF